MTKADWRVVATDNQARESVAEKVRMAEDDFDAWISAHFDEVGEMGIREQAEIYVNDCAWHSRETCI